jgi:hypothetical protein
MQPSQYRTLTECRRDNWCYMCQEREAVTNDGENAPMCAGCKERYWVEEAK